MSKDKDFKSRNFKPRKGREERTSRKDVNPKTPFNDFSWYNENEHLTKGVASIPFPNKPGMFVPIVKGTVAAEKAGVSIPGVLSLEYAMSVGYSDSVVSPISIAAKEMYGKIREKFSGSLPEDAPDILVYVMALDSIYACIGEMKRLYRMINAYSPYNYAVPDGLLKAAVSGISPSDVGSDAVISALRADKMKLYTYINELVGMTQKFVVPSKFNIISRHYWLGDNVYADDNTIASQLYIFVNKYHYKFGLINEAGGLVPVSWPVPSSVSSMVDGMYAHVRELIETLANSEDAYTISGHLARAYEDAPQFSVDYMPLESEFTPLYVPRVLQQIENSRTIPGTLVVDSLQVKQDQSTNALIHQPSFTMSTSVGSNLSIAKVVPMLSIRSDVPTVEDVVEASRLHMSWMETTTEGTYRVVAGTEVFLTMQLFTPVNFAPSGYEADLSYPEFNSYWVMEAPWNTDVMNAGLLDFKRVMTLSMFGWHPMVYCVISRTTTVDSHYRTEIRIMGDVHNITTLTPEALADINRVCVYSEFGSFSQAR